MAHAGTLPSLREAFKGTLVQITLKNGNGTSNALILRRFTARGCSASQPLANFRAPCRPWSWLLQKGDLPSYPVPFFQGALHENQGDFREGIFYSPVEPLEPQ